MKKTNTKPIIYNFNYCNNVFEAYAVVPVTKFKNSKDFTDLDNKVSNAEAAFVKFTFFMYSTREVKSLSCTDDIFINAKKFS